MSQRDVDEPIELVEYDPRWPRLFEEERDRVLKAVGPVAAIEHVGSTAVPGMAGKPIVDLLVGVESLAAAHALVPSLEALGYESFGEIFVPGRLYLRTRGHVHFNIALTERNGTFWCEQLLLRDYLRQHPGEAAAYSRVKRVAYRDGKRLFSTYSRAKGPYLAELKERARRWQPSGGDPGHEMSATKRPT